MRRILYLLFLTFCCVSKVTAISIETVDNKKIKKAIKSVYEIDNYKLIQFLMEDSLTDKSFYSIVENDSVVGILSLSSAKGRYDNFDYGMVLTNTFEVKKILVLKYRSNYGYQIANKRWLKQFQGLKPSKKFNYGKEVDAISGATLSGPAFVMDVKMTLAYLKNASLKAGI